MKLNGEWHLAHCMPMNATLQQRIAGHIEHQKRFINLLHLKFEFTTVYYYGLFESLHFIMESGMMMGIKQRAEKNKNGK